MNAPPSVDWDTIETCVLDMDGTLLDLNFDDHVWNIVLPQFFAAQNEITIEAASSHVRSTLDQERGSLKWYCFEHWTRVFDVEMSKVEEHVESLIKRHSDSTEFLEFIAAKPCRRVLATNAHPWSLERKLEKTGIGEYFHAVVSAHEYGFPKEDDRFWGTFFETLDLDPQRTLFIDDNEAVLASARSFGVAHVFGVTNPNSRGEAKSYDDFVGLDSLAQLVPGST